MLKAHFDAIESTLIAKAGISANSGHNLHKGNPREHFVKEFLGSHLSDRVAIGTGEIISAESRPGEKRNQIDVVIYRRDFPKLNFGGDTCAFLAESVIATIEVKSRLTKEELRKANSAAVRLKGLDRHLTNGLRTGYQPPTILNYVVAYDGPASMDTVYEWKNEICKGIQFPLKPPSLKERIKLPSPCLDAVFVLGKGFMYFDNCPIQFLWDGEREKNPFISWLFGDAKDGNLLLFFTMLTAAASGFSSSTFNALPYLKTAYASELKWGV